ncbi:MAG: isoprenyl transferase [Anaerovoracaceae bacterium]
MLDMNRIPAHVAIIMDGNGRWAKKRNLPRVMGHNAGMKAMKEIVRECGTLGIKHLTVYAFSTENWKRTEEEINGIFGLLVTYVDKELNEICQNNVKLAILGDLTDMPEKVKSKLDLALEKTKDNTGLQFNIALNYGGRDEILRAVKEIVKDNKAGLLKDDDITEATMAERLFTGKHSVPDPDLVIRTSGEIRLSNFLLWQLAYSEMVFTDILWPDYTPEEFKKSICEYQSRDRRFGGR